MIYTNVLSDILTEAGIAFESVGRGDGQSGLTWCGMPVRVLGISVDKLTEAQQALNAHPLDLSLLKEERFAWNDANRDAQLLTLAQTPITLNGQSYTLSPKERDMNNLIEDVSTAALGSTITFPTTVGPVDVPVADATPIAVAIKAARKAILRAHQGYECAVNNATTLAEVPAESWS